jgi:hypothetical protein
MSEYEFAEPAGWARAVTRFRTADRDHFGSLLLRGSCPRCHHAMDVLVPLECDYVAVSDAQAAAEVAAASEEPRVIPVTKVDNFASFQLTALCNCHVDHPGRPEDVKEGCGAFGNVKVSRAPGQVSAITLEKGTPAAAQDAKWQQLADELPFETLQRVRSSAAKWAATIGSITGVFAIVTLIKGPEDISKLASPWKGSTVVLVILSLALATVGLYAAATAAQGNIDRARVAGGTVRELHRTGIESAVKNLTVSKWAVVLSVASLAMAILITWTKTPAEAAPSTAVLVISGSPNARTSMCGSLVGTTMTDLLVRPPDAKDAITIPLDEVLAVSSVAGCPGEES